MNYWIDLFTGTTWDQFRQAGPRLPGAEEVLLRARPERRSLAQDLGDLCAAMGSPSTSR